MRSVSKQQLVEGIAGRLDMQKKDTEKVVNALIDEIKDCFRKGQRVELHQFGTFMPQKRKPRKMRVPLTGKECEVGPRTVLRFKASRHMVIENQGVR